MKTITRKLIIRLDQFNKVRKIATKYDTLIGDSPYDRAGCEPLTRKEIEQYWLPTLLKNPNLHHCDPVKYFLIRHCNYDSNYADQICRPPIDEDNDSIWVWPPRCKDEKQLVWGVFEKDVVHE